MTEAMDCYEMGWNVMIGHFGSIKDISLRSTEIERLYEKYNRWLLRQEMMLKFCCGALDCLKELDREQQPEPFKEIIYD